jgi:hypothetical protein
MMWRQIFTFVQSAMLNILAHPWGVRIWAIAGALTIVLCMLGSLCASQDTACDDDAHKPNLPLRCVLATLLPAIL